MTGTGTVAIAVIIHAGRVLLVRPQDPGGSPHWQFPAAAVEPGETVAEAAVREAGQATSMEPVARAVLGGQAHPGMCRTASARPCGLTSTRPSGPDRPGQPARRHRPGQISSQRKTRIAMTVSTALKPSSKPMAGRADAGPRPRASTFCTPTTRYRSGST